MYVCMHSVEYPGYITNSVGSVSNAVSNVSNVRNTVSNVCNISNAASNVSDVRYVCRRGLGFSKILRLNVTAP